ncbi:MAG: hypothetical protein LBD90_03840 [Bifidobacteriaceae bacterium]|nr:hypothetical protein [Bifidobacteriaceae bacterium]
MSDAPTGTLDSGIGGSTAAPVRALTLTGLGAPPRAGRKLLSVAGRTASAWQKRVADNLRCQPMRGGLGLERGPCAVLGGVAR